MRVHGRVAFKVMGLVVVCGLLVYWYSASDGRTAQSDNCGESRLGSPTMDGPDTRAPPSGANGERVQQTHRDREKVGVLPLAQDESDHHWNQNRRTSTTMKPHLMDNSSLNAEVATILKGGVLPLEQDVRDSEHYWNQNPRTSTTIEPQDNSLNVEM